MEFILLIVLGLGALIYFGTNSSQGNSIVSQVVNTASAAVNGGNLSAQDIATLASNAGFTGDDIATATSIASAESGGDPNAYNPETKAGAPQGMGSYGLWQIYLNAHPEFAGYNLFDPLENASAAYQVWESSGFRAWSTYKDGEYQAFIDTAIGAVNS